MLWPPIILMALAAIAVSVGIRITNGPGSGDERAGGAIYVVVGLFLALLAIALWAVAVTVKTLG